MVVDLGLLVTMVLLLVCTKGLLLVCALRWLGLLVQSIAVANWLLVCSGVIGATIWLILDVLVDVCVGNLPMAVDVIVHPRLMRTLGRRVAVMFLTAAALSRMLDVVL